MSRAEEIVGVRYSEMNEKQRRIYHNTLRNESHRRNKDKVKEQNRKYREQKKEYITKIEKENKILEKALELACERVKYFEEMQDKEMGFSEFFGYESDYDLQAIIEQYKQQAEKEIENG